MADCRIAQLLERVQLRIEDNLVRDYRASISYAAPEDTAQVTQLGYRVAKCVADTRKLVTEASDFLLEPHAKSTPNIVLLSRSGGVGLQLAERANRLARADSAEARNRLERLLETQIARDIPLPLTPSNPDKKVENTVKPRSHRRDGVAIDEKEKECLLSAMGCFCSGGMKDLIEKVSAAINNTQ